MKAIGVWRRIIVFLWYRMNKLLIIIVKKLNYYIFFFLKEPKSEKYCICLLLCKWKKMSVKRLFSAPLNWTKLCLFASFKVRLHENWFLWRKRQSGRRWRLKRKKKKKWAIMKNETMKKMMIKKKRKKKKTKNNSEWKNEI